MLTDKELMKIASMPDLETQQFQPILKTTLPYKVDNSTQPYMIATTWQNGYECGQSASIADARGCFGILAFELVWSIFI